MYEELFEYNRLWIELAHYWRIAPHMYAGVYGRVNHLYNVQSQLEGNFETVKPPGYMGYTVAGIAPAFQIDSRDSQVYPRKGYYLELLWTSHPSFMSDFTFGNVRLDARMYRSFDLLKDDVLATHDRERGVLRLDVDDEPVARRHAG